MCIAFSSSPLYYVYMCISMYYLRIATNSPVFGYTRRRQLYGGFHVCVAVLDGGTGGVDDALKEFSFFVVFTTCKLIGVAATRPERYTQDISSMLVDTCIMYIREVPSARRSCSSFL